MIYFNYNGKIMEEGALILGADNRGLRYGDGLFETIKMINGRLVFEDEHFARLWKGMALLQFEIPKHFTADKLQNEIKALAIKNNHEAFARVRLTIIRGDGGVYDLKSYGPNYIIQTWPLEISNGELNSNGLVVGIYTDVKKSCDVLSNFKHNNYLPYVLAALSAKKGKWNDAILLNTEGRLCDTTTANIFIVKDEVIYTPPLSEGCVAGILRRIIIKSLLDTNWQVVEKSLTIADLLNADEVFLTNSIRNIRWVKQAGDTTYINSVTQKIFAALCPTFL